MEGIKVVKKAKYEAFMAIGVAHGLLSVVGRVVFGLCW